MLSRSKYWVCALVLAACGHDVDGTLDELAGHIESPTGTLTEGNASAVMESRSEFGLDAIGGDLGAGMMGAVPAMRAGLFGDLRRYAQRATAEWAAACDTERSIDMDEYGGSGSVSYAVDCEEGKVYAFVEYDDLCYGGGGVYGNGIEVCVSGRIDMRVQQTGARAGEVMVGADLTVSAGDLEQSSRWGMRYGIDGNDFELEWVTFVEDESYVFILNVTDLGEAAVRADFVLRDSSGEYSCSISRAGAEGSCEDLRDHAESIDW